MRNHGFTLIETLLAAIVLLLALAGFAVLSAQSARTLATSQLTSYASDALQSLSQAINQGNPTYTHAATLNGQDLALLMTENGNHRQAATEALSGVVTPLGSDPPRFRVTVGNADFRLSAVATAPGGTP